MELIRRWSTVLWIASLSVALAGCDLPLDPEAPPEDKPRAQAPNVPGAAQGQAPVEALKLSEHNSARWSDVAVGPDGRLHVVFQDTPARSTGQIYYRSSDDGGATWSAIVNLSEPDRTREAGVPQVVVDGQGRVYAIWNALEGSKRDSLAGGPYGGNLIYRVLEPGGWSDIQAIDSHRQVVSWFPSVDPTGAVHVVWVEHIKTEDGYQTIAPAHFFQAGLAGAMPTAPQEIRKLEPTVPTHAGYIQTFDQYHGLRGYVDAAGDAHFSAVKTLAGEGQETDTLVLWDGKQEQELFAMAPYYSGGPYYNPPELLVDAQGREHVLLVDQKGDRKSLLDFTVGERQPVVVRQAPDPAGTLKTFQVVQGTGSLAALMSFKDTIDGRFDLYVSQYQGGAWSEAVNVTDNRGRETFKQFEGNNDTSVSTTYEPSFAAGAFDAQGRLNLAVVNDEKVYLTSSAEKNGVSGMVDNPVVYFFKL